MDEIELLRAVYSSTLRGGRATLEAVVAASGRPREEAEGCIQSSEKSGLIRREGGELVITQMGRAKLRVVMIGGAFEIIHPGHLHTIEQARKYGNTLVVVVATDKTVAKNKGRDPVTSQEWRVKLVSSMKEVDIAIPGGQGSIYDTLEKVRPDVVALGYDQTHNPADIEAEARRRGLELSVVRLSTPLPDVKTSKIVNAL